MNKYLEKIAESSDYSWLVPAASVTVPIAAGGVAQYAALQTKDKFETKPEQRLLNKALRSTALKSTLGLSLAGGTAAGLAEFSRRKYLENQKRGQNTELKQALRTTIREELS